MSRNGADSSLEASGLEDRSNGQTRMDGLDGTGDFLAALDRTGNVFWTTSIQGIFHRRDGMHAGGGGTPWTTRNLRDPAVVPVDLFQPVRVHDRLQVRT